MGFLDNMELGGKLLLGLFLFLMIWSIISFLKKKKKDK